MPHISQHVQMTGGTVAYFWPTFVELVAAALAEGKRVEINSSSFSDPGKDWNELMIDGVVVPGSRVEGY